MPDENRRHHRGSSVLLALWAGCATLLCALLATRAWDVERGARNLSQDLSNVERGGRAGRLARWRGWETEALRSAIVAAGAPSRTASVRSPSIFDGLVSAVVAAARARNASVGSTEPITAGPTQVTAFDGPRTGGALLAVGSDGARGLDADTGHLLGRSLLPTTGAVARLSADGAWALTALGGSVQAWRVDGTLLHTLGASSAAIRGMALAPAGDVAAVAFANGSVALWNSATWTALGELSTAPAEPVSLAFSPSGRQVAAGGSDGIVRVWDVASRSLAHTLQGHRGAVRSAVYTPDGERLLTGSDDGTARLWDTRGGRSLAELGGRGDGHHGPVRSATTDTTGRYIVTASDDGTARVWNANSGRLLAVLMGHSGPVRAAIFAPAGDVVATGGDDGTVRLFHGPSGEPLGVVGPLHGAVRALAASASGNTLIAGADAVELVPLAYEAWLRRACQLFPGEDHDADVRRVCERLTRR